MRIKIREKFSADAREMRMVRLDFEEARSLASVFGELDATRVLTLLLFQEPASKWDKTKTMGEWPRSYRIPTSSFYRIVDDLVADGFLEPVEGSERRGRGGVNVVNYQTTLKGFLAGGIHAYALLVGQRKPIWLKKIRAEELVRDIEANPGWLFIVSWLRWHRDRKIDLSHVSVDFSYMGLAFVSALLDRPDDVNLNNLQALAQSTSNAGLSVPEVSAKTVEEFHKSAGRIRSLGIGFFTELVRKVRTNQKTKEQEK